MGMGSVGREPWRAESRLLPAVWQDEVLRGPCLFDDDCSGRAINVDGGAVVEPRGCLRDAEDGRNTQLPGDDRRVGKHTAGLGHNPRCDAEQWRPCRVSVGAYQDVSNADSGEVIGAADNPRRSGDGPLAAGRSHQSCRRCGAGAGSHRV